MKIKKNYKALKAALFIGIMSITLIECKKEPLKKKEETNNTTPSPTTTKTTTTISPSTTTTTTTTSSDNYSSLKDFFAENEVSLQTFTVDGTNGGTFTTPQGTKVTIPANAFVTDGGISVTGNITIQFKDFYDKNK